MEPAGLESGNYTLRPFVEMLQAGDPIGHANLTLVPLRGEGHGVVDYILGEEAISAGVLVISETSAAGSVPELLADNRGEKMVLLIDGEELVGAKQNRILNTSILLPAGTQVKIPVSCVEQGRWNHVSHNFSSGHQSPAGLRALKSRDVTRNLRATGLAHSDQGAVWEQVACCMAAVGSHSPTMAMHDAYEQRRASLDGYIEALAYPVGARGVVVAINGRFVAMDIFHRPDTLERIWPRLVSGYAIDAISRGGVGGGCLSARGALALVEHIGETPCVPCLTVGVGEDWRFEAEDVVGQALVAPCGTLPGGLSGCQKACVHLCAFPSEGRDRSQAPGRGILPPSRRRMNRQ